MTAQFAGDRTLMRVFIGESDRCGSGPHRGRPPCEAILLTLENARVVLYRPAGEAGGE